MLKESSNKSNERTRGESDPSKKFYYSTPFQSELLFTYSILETAVSPATEN